MSAAEIIEQIKVLPPEEQREVSRFLLAQLGTEQNSSGKPIQHPTIRYATNEQARAAGDAVVAEYPETFRRLAE